MTYFPDVNVWIAMYSPGHIHRQPAMDWFGHSTEHDVAFSRITQMGFLRLLTNRHVMDNNAMSPSAAWQAFDGLFKNTRISLAIEPPNMEGIWRSLTQGAPSGANAWTDAYLSAFAIASGFTLVTFDVQLAGWRNPKALLLK